MNTKFAGFIAAGGHHPPIGGAPDQHRFVIELGVDQPFTGDKEGVQIQVNDGPVFHFFSIKYLE